MNNVRGFQNDGIYLHTSQHNNISKNTIKDATNGYGILEYSSDYNTIYQNTIKNVGYGIYIEYSNFINILENNVNNILYNGILLYNTSHSLVNKNTLSNSSYLNGIQINYYSLYNSITYNNILNNSGYGLQITEYSIGNRIHHNNFIDNNGVGKQGWDDTNKNYWNDTAEGNYWSDYHLLTQGCSDTNSNGICDAPYVLAGGAGALDWYPITTPMVPEFPSVNLVWLAAVLIAAIVVAIRNRKK
jgi:parallel beta-helix repeat protein